MKVLLYVYLQGEPKKPAPKKTTGNETDKSKSVQSDVNPKPKKPDRKKDADNKSAKPNEAKAGNTNKSTKPNDKTSEKTKEVKTGKIPNKSLSRKREHHRQLESDSSSSSKSSPDPSMQTMKPVVPKLKIPEGAIAAKVTKHRKILNWIYDKNGDRKHHSKPTSHKRQGSESSASDGHQTMPSSSKSKNKSSSKDEGRRKSAKTVENRNDRAESSTSKQLNPPKDKDSPLRRRNSQFLSSDDVSSDNSVSILDEMFESPKRKKARLEVQNLTEKFSKIKSEETKTDREVKQIK